MCDQKNEIPDFLFESQEVIEYKSFNYREFITLDKIPKWKCPHCQNGYLLMKENLNSIESQSNQEIQKNPDFEPDWLKFTLSDFFSCDNCKEKTAIIGNGTFEFFEEYYSSTEGRQSHELAFMPKYFVPTLHIFEIPYETPSNVKNALIESFSLAWCDFSSAANKLRIAIEHLVDHIDEGLTASDLNGKIDQLIGSKNPNKEKNKDYAVLLKAIKWLGNNGSHSTVTLKEHDIAFGYTVMKEVLEKLYNKNIDILKLSKLVDDNKGSLTK